MLLSHGDLFKPLNTPYRIFTKVPTLGRHVDGDRDPHTTANLAAAQGSSMYELAMQTMRTPQLIVHADGTVAAINDAARTAFRLLASDLGRPFQDLEISYRPADLRTPIDTATSNGDPSAPRRREPRRRPRVALLRRPGHPARTYPRARARVRRSPSSK